MTEINFTTHWFFSEYDPWLPHRAIDEIEVYSELLEHLQDRIDSLETRGRDEEGTLTNVYAVISSYAVEIAMQSLWALDHLGEPVLRTHDIVELFDDLNDETRKSLEGFPLPRQVLEGTREPFFSNRYSMEHESRSVTLYHPLLLRKLTQLLRDTLEDRQEDVRKTLIKKVKLSGE